MHLQGKKFYNLAVPAHGQNSIVLEKDSYNLSSNVCDVKYTSTKDLAKSQMIILGNPTSILADNVDKKTLLQPKKTMVKSNPSKTNNNKKKKT
jgi:hypothetical protein